MKVNAYGVIPAAVRYNPKLSVAAKLLYSEITAAANYEGEIEFDIQYFSSFLASNERTTYRYIKELEDGGHICRKTKGKEKVLMLTNSAITLSPPEETKAWTGEDEIFFDELLLEYERGLGVELKRNIYYPTLAERQKSFSKTELTRALRNRVKFINTDEWHREHKAIATGAQVKRFELIGHLLGGADNLWKTEALAMHLGHLT